MVDMKDSNLAEERAGANKMVRMMDSLSDVTTAAQITSGRMKGAHLAEELAETMARMMDCLSAVMKAERMAEMTDGLLVASLAEETADMKEWMLDC
eukprot:scaffold10013_cov79-Skeletonema_dohrnii-CCMP3373.AAC.5